MIERILELFKKMCSTKNNNWSPCSFHPGAILYVWTYLVMNLLVYEDCSILFSLWLIVFTHSNIHLDSYHNIFPPAWLCKWRNTIRLQRKKKTDSQTHTYLSDMNPSLTLKEFCVIAQDVIVVCCPGGFSRHTESQTDL